MKPVPPLPDVNPILALIGDLALLSGGLAIILFAIFYGLRNNWRITLAGRSMMYLAASMSIIILLVGYGRAASQFGWPFPARGWIRLGAYLIIGYTMWRQFVTLLLYQRHGKKPDQPDPDRIQHTSRRRVRQDSKD